jgi:hypothetical protein
MTYKIKQAREIPKGYFKQKEIENLRKKKNVSFIDIERETMREATGMQKIIHRQGAIVEYKGDIAKVKKVTKKGLWLQPFKSNGIITPSGRAVFVSEENIEKGKVYPYAVEFGSIVSFVT